MRPQVSELLSRAPQGGRILDIGCAGFQVKAGSDALGRSDLRHSGLDYSAPDAVPHGVEFLSCDLNAQPIPAPDDAFDVVIAGHVIEHMRDPIEFFGEAVRVLKPGGTLYLEAPSERSMMLPGMWFAFDESRSLSFWDDPTHLGRPWPPQALYRLA